MIDWIVLVVYLAGIPVTAAIAQRLLRRSFENEGLPWDGNEEVASWFLAVIIGVLWPACAVLALVALAARRIQRAWDGAAKQEVDS